MFLDNRRMKLFFKESQTIFTVSYVIAIGIGMLFMYQKYAEFGINIFDYAGVFDFLIAPFSDFRILFFTVGSLLVTYLIYLIDKFYQQRYPRVYSKANFGLDRKYWYRSLRNISAFVLFILYLGISAFTYGTISKKEILEQTPIQVTFVDNQTKTGQMIGKTKEVIFLTNENTVEVIPITSLVKEIRVNQFNVK